MQMMEMLQYLFFKQTCNLSSVVVDGVTLVSRPCDVQVGPLPIIMGFYLVALLLSGVLLGVEAQVNVFKARWLR